VFRRHGEESEGEAEKVEASNPPEEAPGDNNSTVEAPNILDEPRITIHEDD
jgi:hypothetical protein